MVDIIKVRSKNDQNEFLNFPLRLYKDCEYFVPPLWADEKKIFSKNYIYNDSCESEYFLAKKDGVTVGRISAILQRASNEKHGEKRVRFTRFDCIDDTEVSRALFSAVEDFATEKGMDTVCGPLGFSDLEREGLLIEGFDRLSTYEEQYNYDYYPKLVEDSGYAKEVDWNESILRAPDPESIAQMKKMSEFVMNRYKLRIGKAKNVGDFINKYADGLFELIDIGYEGLYGTVPFTDGMKKMMIDNFKLIIDLKYVAAILDENDKIVCMGICFPSLARAVQRSRGHMTPAALVRLLGAIKHPKVLDLGLIAVHPEYLNRGITAIITAELMRMLAEDNIEYAETNLNLEDNFAIQNQWKRFPREIHKRRRAYVKKVTKAGD